MKKRTQNYYLYIYMSMRRCDDRLQAVHNPYYQIVSHVHLHPYPYLIIVIFIDVCVQHVFHISLCRLTVAQKITLVEQEMLTISSPSVFSSVRVAHCLAQRIAFVDKCKNYALREKSMKRKITLTILKYFLLQYQLLLELDITRSCQ